MITIDHLDPLVSTKVAARQRPGREQPVTTRKDSNVIRLPESLRIQVLREFSDCATPDGCLESLRHHRDDDDPDDEPCIGASRKAG